MTMLKCNEAGCEEAANHVLLIPPVEPYPLGTYWEDVPFSQRGDIYAYCDEHLDPHVPDYDPKTGEGGLIVVNGQEWTGHETSTLHLIQVMAAILRHL
jgi:hypothetical protein